MKRIWILRAVGPVTYAGNRDRYERKKAYPSVPGEDRYPHQQDDDRSESFFAPDPGPVVDFKEQQVPQDHQQQ